MPNKTKQPRPIFTGEQEETTFLAAGLGELGMSTQAIAEECGLSLGQVLYRLKTLQVKRRDFRNGTSKAFAYVRLKMLDEMDDMVRRRWQRRK